MPGNFVHPLEDTRAPLHIQHGLCALRLSLSLSESVIWHVRRGRDVLAARSSKHYKRTMWATAWAEAAGEIRSEEAVGTTDNQARNAETQTFETYVKTMYILSAIKHSLQDPSGVRTHSIKYVQHAERTTGRELTQDALTS